MIVKVPGKCERCWPSKRKQKAHSVVWVGMAGICLNCGKGFLKRRRRA
jgi:hypothetical protein